MWNARDAAGTTWPKSFGKFFRVPMGTSLAEGFGAVLPLVDGEGLEASSVMTKGTPDRPMVTAKA
jgi:hypothetical protein